MAKIICLREQAAPGPAKGRRPARQVLATSPLEVEDAMNSQRMVLGWRLRGCLTLVFGFLLLILAAVPAHSQTVIATVPVGIRPRGLAVNPATNKIYVANFDSSNVTVIDGATNSVTTVTDPNASAPFAVAVNPVTNKIYVVNLFSSNVTVIDGATNSVTTVADPPLHFPASPLAVAVNPVTNKIYVPNGN